MLNALRSGASGFLAKLLLALLILSFAVWGIEDMLRVGGSRSALATIDGDEVPREAFERAYHRETERARQLLGKNYSPELVAMLRLERKALEDLITTELLRREAFALGLLPSDEAIAREIRTIEEFQDEKGAFNKTAFLAMLRRNGLSEKAFVEDMRRQIATHLLLETIAAVPPVNDRMAEAVTAAETEERTADIVTLTPSLIKDVTPPDDAQVEAYFAQHSKEFMTPETRVISFLTVTPERLREDVRITPEELQAAYEERAALFEGKAEPLEKVKDTLEKELKFEPEQMDEAAAALSTRIEDLLAGGASLPEVAQELKLKAATLPAIDMNGRTENGKKSAELPDAPEFLETAFRLEEGAESPLIPGANGSRFLLRVESVTAPRAPQLSEARSHVAEAWTRHEKARRLKTLAEDLRKEMHQADAPLTVTAKHGLKASGSGLIRRTSQKTSTDMALPTSLVRDIFSVRPGEVTAAHMLPDGSFMIAVVKERKTPAIEKDSPEAQQARERLEASARDQLLEEYVQYLRGKYDVRINEQALGAYAKSAP